jgi:hypothetical protein
MRFNKQSVIDADWNGEFGLPGNFNIFNIKTYYKEGESPEIPDYDGDTWKSETVESICKSIFKDDKGKPIYTINSITSAIKQVPILAKEVMEAEKQVTKELEEAGRARGGNNKKIFEEGFNF